jgi:hypothetical protein
MKRTDEKGTGFRDDRFPDIPGEATKLFTGGFGSPARMKM